MKTFGIIALCLVSVLVGMALLPVDQNLLASFTMGLNTNPPAYMKDVVAYKEGDGLVIYFTLADASGAYTRAGGFLTVTVREGGFPLWSVATAITHEQFQVARVGQGPFERTTLLYTLGRIGERQFQQMRSGNQATVEVKLLCAGSTFTGEQTVYF